jgi:hypothetical protein
MKEYLKNWEDMSEYLVHFTKAGNENDDYRTMLSIYWQQKLIPKNAFGIGRKISPELTSQRAVCFSEIPPGQWCRLSERRETKYGIAFTKSFVINRGGGPIWYAWKGTQHWQILQKIMRENSEDPSAPIWKLTPLIDAPGEYFGKPYFFDWEREWRFVGEFSFGSEDVAFLIIPEELHEAAKSFFIGVKTENTGPAYLCPYIDPTWERERILETLQS